MYTYTYRCIYVYVKKEEENRIEENHERGGGSDAKAGLAGKQKGRVLVDFCTSEKINWTTFAKGWFSKIEGGDSRNEWRRRRRRAFVSLFSLASSFR